MNEIKNSLPKAKKRNQKLKNFLVFMLLATAVAMLAWYFGNIFFGTRSLDVLLDLRTQKEKLTKEVKQMQEKNSVLQKEYFELIGLDPNYKEGKL